MNLHHHSRQHGATLVIGMIMLILVTLFVLAAINMSTTNLLVMGNEQARNEAIVAAQQVVEQVSSRDFTTNPVAVTATVDVAGNGTTGYSVSVPPPRCLNSVPVKSTELTPVNPDGTVNTYDLPCYVSTPSTSPGVVGSASTGNTNCSATQWDVQATVSDPLNSTGTSVTLHQGISKRIPTGASPC